MSLPVSPEEVRKAHEIISRLAEAQQAEPDLYALFFSVPKANAALYRDVLAGLEALSWRLEAVKDND